MSDASTSSMGPTATGVRPAIAPSAASSAASGAPTRPRDARQLRYAHAFAQAVAVLMRDPDYKRLPIGALEWLLLPPLMAGQWQIGRVPAPRPKEARPAEGGVTIPVNVALWATVSDDVDRRLAAAPEKPLVLKTNEWASGQNVWIVVAGGERRTLGVFLRSLADDARFKDRPVKLRVQDDTGKPVVRTLAEHCRILAQGDAARSPAA